VVEKRLFFNPRAELLKLFCVFMFSCFFGLFSLILIFDYKLFFLEREVLVYIPSSVTLSVDELMFSSLTTLTSKFIP
jgi:hypothetical protein